MAEDQDLQDLLIDEDYGDVDDQKELCRDREMISEVTKITGPHIKTDESGKPIDGKYPYFKIYLRFAQGRFEGRRLSFMLSKHPDMKWMWKQFLDAVHCPTSKPNLTDALGKKIHHMLGVETYMGQQKNNVQTPFSAA